MPLIEVAIPHLLGGVSQQPPAGRQPGQVEAVDNALLHPVNGLTKRPGTRHLARLLPGLESVRLAHWINRDPVERYLVLAGERRVRVFSAEDGTEFQVKVNGTSTNAGRGRIGTGTPINYLDPRTSGGVVDQDEDFVIGAGDWLSVAGNSVTSYVAGRGPFNFGRRESLVTVNADTVAEVGNGAAATVSDIYQDFGTFAKLTALSVYAKKSSSAISDFELTLVTTAPETYGARFAVGADGVITLAAFRVPDGFGGTVDSTVPGNVYAATVESVGHGWYRCTIYFSDTFSGTVLPIVGTTRRLKIRFHTTGANPENKRLLLFGCRCHDIRGAIIPSLGPITLTDTVPAYVHDRPDLFRALTIADSTYLLNTEQTVGATSGTSPAGPGGGITGGVFVKEATPNTIYKLTLRATDGTSTPYSFTTAAGGTDDTVDTVTGLVAAINAGGGLYTAGSNIGSTFLITNGTKTLGSIAATDGQGDEQMIAFRTNGGRVTRFTDLPLQFGNNSTLVKIVGQDNSPTNDFYAKFVLTNPFAFEDGFWEETLAPGIPFLLSAATLPQVLTRRQDNAAGTITGIPNAIYFDVSAVDWDDRLVGDTTTNPDPGFVGAKINDLFLFRGRLGFLSGDKLILSEAGEILNFWRTTVRDLPDTDPIELTSLTQADKLLTAVATADDLIVSSDRRQFQLIAEPALTPSTAQLTPLRAFDFLASVRPADTSRGVVFARTDSGNTGLVETSRKGDDITPKFEELTLQAPRYIAGAARELVHSSLTGLTAIRADDPTIIYLHQTLLDEREERLQSALHRWTLHADALVRGLAFFDEVLRLVVERAEGWFLEEQPTGTELFEASGLPITSLDRRLDQDQLTRAYAGGPDETTLTLPYTIPAGVTMQVVDATSGLLVPIVSQTATTIVVSGDMTAVPLFGGERFDLAVTLSQPVVRDSLQSGSLLPRLSHPVNVHRLTLYLADTAILRVEIARSLRTATSEEFSAAGLGTGLLGMGQLNTFTGPAAFGVIALSTELSCTLKNITPFPSRVQAGRWEVLQHQRAPVI